MAKHYGGSRHRPTLHHSHDRTHSAVHNAGPASVEMLDAQVDELRRRLHVTYGALDDLAYRHGPAYAPRAAAGPNLPNAGDRAGGDQAQAIVCYTCVDAYPCREAMALWRIFTLVKRTLPWQRND
jgi:hypothetical protein